MMNKVITGLLGCERGKLPTLLTQWRRNCCDSVAIIEAKLNQAIAENLAKVKV